MPQVLMVIAPEVFRDEEYAEPKSVFEAWGAAVTTASLRPGICRGKLGMDIRATIAVSEASPTDYDAIVFVGGGGAQVFFDDPDAHALARGAFENNRVVAAICIAPSILAHAGLLDGVRATAFPSQREDLISHGALWGNGPVEVDGSIITANGPDAARAFGLAIAASLGLP